MAAKRPRSAAPSSSRSSSASAAASGAASGASAEAAASSAATAAAGKVAAKDLAERMKDPAFQRDIEQAVRDLPPERAAELVAMLEASMRRRKLELYGYLAAAAIVVVGMVGALLFMGSAKEDSFVGWVFLVPLALAGLVMWLVGKKARADQKAAKDAATSGPRAPRRPAS